MHALCMLDAVSISQREALHTVTFCPATNLRALPFLMRTYHRNSLL
jgi:hypothetical protein